MKSITEIIEIIENFDKEMSPQLAAHKVLAYMQERESEPRPRRVRTEKVQITQEKPDLEPPKPPENMQQIPNDVMDKISQ